MGRRLWLLLGLALMGLVGGCSSPFSKVGDPTSPVPTVTSPGYSLLLELLGKQKDVSKVFIIKGGRPEFKDLIDQIAEASRISYEEMNDWFQKGELGDNGLPWVEKKTRESIESNRTKQLLLSRKQNFELELILSQMEGLDYGSHMAESLAIVERDMHRKVTLQNLARRYESLHEQLFKMMVSKYKPE